MAHPITLPTVAALALAGMGFGVYLGKSAVAEINPAHFSAFSGSSFYSDLVPNPPDRDAASELRDASFTADYAMKCVGCRTYREDNAPVFAAEFDDYEPYEADFADYGPAYVAPPADIIEDVDREIAEVARQAARESVARYTDFPVSKREESARLILASSESGSKHEPATADHCTSDSSCAGEATPGI